jgi:mannosyltransferase OCH1-like enzyme
MIPRVIHRVWLGPNPLPPRAERYWDAFAAVHPDWQLRTWRDDDVVDFSVAHLFASCSSRAMEADLVRLELLWREGGIYVDTDVEPVRSMEPLLAHRLVLGHVGDGYLQTAVIGAVAGQAGLGRLVRSLAGLEKLPPGRANVVTGPYAVTLVLGEDPDLHLLEPDVLYPWRWGEQPCRPGPRTVALHHWDKSWVGRPRRSDALRWKLIWQLRRAARVLEET